jgi:hypothetical protein
VLADGVDRPFVAAQGGEAFARGRVALVGEVVGVAREAVDRGDRAPLAPRHQQRGDREVFVVVERSDRGR